MVCNNKLDESVDFRMESDGEEIVLTPLCPIPNEEYAVIAYIMLPEHGANDSEELASLLDAMACQSCEVEFETLSRMPRKESFLRRLRKSVLCRRRTGE